MAQYAVYHGGFSANLEDAGVVAIKTDGKTMTVTCPREMMEEWEARLSPKGRISKFIDKNQIDLISYVSRNPYETWTGFTDEEGYEEFIEVYNSVKGVKKVIVVK